ncbi:type II methionyl aminopeptidase [Candidatus Woesearchaeota archaeon]|nr:type II methionyl aminopeptidase [Candidatus Woesearchaeota archaeon]
MTSVQNISSWRKAGVIAAESLDYAKKLVVKNASLLEVSEKIEEFITSKGAVPAFPVQLSCDNIAAHYCAYPGDETIFQEQVVCVDVGVCVDGCIGDTACTIDLSGKYSELVSASRQALNSAIKLCTPGTEIGIIGRAVQEIITAKGFSPIRNLSGHGLDKYTIHSEPQIPNVDTKDSTKLLEGMIIAVEPFASTGTGIVKESGASSVFSLNNVKPVRSREASQVLQLITKEWNSLPFCTRWITKKFGIGTTARALRELMTAGIITAHPPLFDTGIVSQAEHTIIVEEKPIILTKSTNE